MQPNDYAILKALVEIGPARPSEIADKVPPEISSVAIRERIWLLAGLDNVVAERDERLVAQSARNGKWALADEISQSERGRIPTETRTLIQRIRDERVRRALDRGVDRATVAEVIDMHERSTWHMQRRALAYDFPLDALARGTDEPLVVAETDGRSRGLPEAPEEVDKPMQIGKDRGMDVVAGRTEGGTGIADVGEDCTELAALGEQLEEILNVLEEIGDAL